MECIWEGDRDDTRQRILTRYRRGFDRVSAGYYAASRAVSGAIARNDSEEVPLMAGPLVVAPFRNPFGGRFSEGFRRRFKAPFMEWFRYPSATGQRSPNGAIKGGSQDTIKSVRGQVPERCRKGVTERLRILPVPVGEWTLFFRRSQQSLARWLENYSARSTEMIFPTLRLCTNTDVISATIRYPAFTSGVGESWLGKVTRRLVVIFRAVTNALSRRVGKNSNV